MAWTDAAREAALEARRRKAKVKEPFITLYHGTSLRNALAVQRAGLMVKRGQRAFPRAYYLGDRDKSVFGSASYREAAAYARQQKRNELVLAEGPPDPRPPRRRVIERANLGIVQMRVPTNMVHRDSMAGGKSYYVKGGVPAKYIVAVRKYRARIARWFA